MFGVLVVLVLTLVGVAGSIVAFTDDPQRQAVVLSVFGLLISVLFFVLQAPDVALSEVGVGMALVPLMVMLTIRKIRSGSAAEHETGHDSDSGDEG